MPGEEKNNKNWPDGTAWNEGRIIQYHHYIFGSISHFSPSVGPVSLIMVPSRHYYYGSVPSLLLRFHPVSIIMVPSRQDYHGSVLSSVPSSVRPVKITKDLFMELSQHPIIALLPIVLRMGIHAALLSGCFTLPK